jgi:uncharacterized repeat protein (TIGR03943 family)
MKAQLKKAIPIIAAWLPVITYVLWLNAYYWLFKGGRYKAFIQPKLWPLLILALLILLAFTATFIARFSMKGRVALSLDTSIKAAILVLPLFFLWSIYGRSLGADAFAKRSLNPGQITIKGKSNPFKSLPNTFADRTVSLLDLLAEPERFDGKRVATEGMVYRNANASENAFMLFRFAVVCCAADALPLSVTVKTAAARTVNSDAWLKVEGIFKLETIKGRYVASIAADSIQPIPMPPPEKRYLFF